MKNKYIFILILVFLSVLYWFIEPVGVDMGFHVLRIGELARELSRTGSIPVYIYRDLYNHYGYPIPLFYCSLFLYPFSGLVVAGLSAVTAYKMMTVVILWMVYGISYMCISHMSEFTEISSMAAFIYTIQPFFINELFVRSSIGAACVFVFVPIVVLGIYYIFLYTGKDKMLAGILCLGGGMAGIVMSHVISAILITVAVMVLFIIAFIRYKHRAQILLGALMSAAICILLTAWYVFPVIEQFSGYVFKSQSVTWLQIGAENPVAIMLPMHLFIALSHVLPLNMQLSEIGGVPLLFFLVTVYLFATGRIRLLRRSGRVLLALYHVLCLLLLIQPLWKSLGHFFGFMQFGWRIFLIISLIGTAMLIMLLAEADDKCRGMIAVVSVLSAAYVLFFFFGYSAVKNMMPSFVGNIVGHEVESYEYSLETADNLYIPISMDETKLAQMPRRVVLDDNASGADDSEVTYMYSLDEERGIVSLDIVDNTSSETVYLTVPFIMYNGYSAVNTDSGLSYEVLQSLDGLVDVRIPAGERGEITVSYTGTFLQRISFIVSFLSCAAFMISVLILIWKNNGATRFIHAE